MHSQSPSFTHPSVDRESFGTLADGRAVDAITLSNSARMHVRVLTYGAIIQSLYTPDRDGKLDDVVLGYDSIEEYARDTRYFGAIVGRYANRIAGARFTLDGVTYQLPANDGANHLHGGPNGFQRAVWTAEPFEDDGKAGVRLALTSPDGDAGYPGTLLATVTYTLTESNDIVVDFAASSDRPTPVNLTQHSYFNLAGHDRGDVLSHELTLAASRYTPVGATLIPTGELRDVSGTPFDFRKPTPIGARIRDADEQIRIGNGYDHNFVLDRAANGAASLAARLCEPVSGRVMEVLTTEPGLQLYTGNGLDGRAVGKEWRVYGQYGGVALETQHFPDSPNQPQFPSCIVRPGAERRSRTVFRFSTAAADKLE
ncbi:MAG: aldose epimerase family protein [Gemmatimonadaceae bacterium]